MEAELTAVVAAGDLYFAKIFGVVVDGPGAIRLGVGRSAVPSAVLVVRAVLRWKLRAGFWFATQRRPCGEENMSAQGTSVVGTEPFCYASTTHNVFTL